MTVKELWLVTAEEPDNPIGEVRLDTDSAIAGMVISIFDVEDAPHITDRLSKVGLLLKEFQG